MIFMNEICWQISEISLKNVAWACTMDSELMLYSDDMITDSILENLFYISIDF